MSERTPTPVGNVMRAAANRLEEALNSLPAQDWGWRPWHTEEDENGKLTIVAQGEHRPPGRPQSPAIQYVADAENEQFAAYINLMHPGVGRAFVTHLRREAHRVDGLARLYRDLDWRKTYGDSIECKSLDQGSRDLIKLAQQILSR